MCVCVCACVCVCVCACVWSGGLISSTKVCLTVLSRLGISKHEVGSKRPITLGAEACYAILSCNLNLRLILLCTVILSVTTREKGNPTARTPVYIQYIAVIAQDCIPPLLKPWVLNTHGMHFLWGLILVGFAGWKPPVKANTRENLDRTFVQW